MKNVAALLQSWGFDVTKIVERLNAWGFDVQHLTSRQVFLLICIGTIILLLLSMLFRSRRGSAKSKPVAVKPVVAKPVPQKPPVQPVAASVVTPVVSAPITPVEPPRPAPLRVSTLPVSSTTAGALSPTRLYASDLPRVEPADTPLAGNEDRTFGMLNPTLATFLPDTNERREETKLELLTAGRYQPHALENLQATRYVLMILGLIVGGTFLIMLPPRFEPWCIGALIVLPLLGWAIPRLIVKSEAAARKSEIEKGMPDMLDMLNMCVSQGMTMPVALERVGVELETVHPELHKELKIVSEQTKIGSLDHAMHNFRRRIDVPEVHSFANLMMQTERMGTSVSQALAEYSDNMRAALKQRADEKGNRAAFKLLFPTVLCLMPAIYLFLLGPAVISFSRNWVDTQSRIRESTERINGLNR